MNRSKLEYLMKELSVQEKNNIIVEIDPEGDYEFGSLTSKFLKNPTSKDPFILLAVPYYQDPKNIENFIKKRRRNVK